MLYNVNSELLIFLVFCLPIAFHSPQAILIFCEGTTRMFVVRS